VRKVKTFFIFLKFFLHNKIVCLHFKKTDDFGICWTFSFNIEPKSLTRWSYLLAKYEMLLKKVHKNRSRKVTDDLSALVKVAAEKYGHGEKEPNHSTTWRHRDLGKRLLKAYPSEIPEWLTAFPLTKAAALADGKTSKSREFARWEKKVKDSVDKDNINHLQLWMDATPTKKQTKGVKDTTEEEEEEDNTITLTQNGVTRELEIVQQKNGGRHQNTHLLADEEDERKEGEEVVDFLSEHSISGERKFKEMLISRNLVYLEDDFGRSIEFKYDTKTKSMKMGEDLEWILCDHGVCMIDLI
jgi:hypothetical protein